MLKELLYIGLWEKESDHEVKRCLFDRLSVLEMPLGRENIEMLIKDYEELELE